MSKYIAESTDLTAVADAIRAKSGGSSQLSFPDGFVSEIGNISDIEKIDAIGTSPADAVNVTFSKTPSSYVVLCYPDQELVADETYYQTRTFYKIKKSILSGSGQSILRPNGTVGSDSTCADYDSSTGVLRIGGGAYGKALSGVKYACYQIDLD